MKRILLSILLVFALLAIPVMADEPYQPIGQVQKHFIEKLGYSDLSFRELPKEVQFMNMTFKQTSYSEPSKSDKHFRACYMDDGGFYHITIQSTGWKASLKQYEHTSCTFLIDKRYTDDYDVSDYLKTIADKEKIVYTEASVISMQRNVWGTVTKSCVTSYSITRAKHIDW